MISARAFPTHCKTKTTPRSRSTVFTPAISKFPSADLFSSVSPDQSSPDRLRAQSPLLPPGGLRRSPAAPAAFKNLPALQTRRTELVFFFFLLPFFFCFPACATQLCALRDSEGEKTRSVLNIYVYKKKNSCPPPINRNKIKKFSS